MVGLNQIDVELYLVILLCLKSTNKKRSREKNTRHQTFRLKKYIPKMLSNTFSSKYINKEITDEE